MAINVYWSCLEDEWQRSEEPCSIKNIFFNKYKGNDFLNCPAIKDSLNNVYGIKSIYDYSFNLESGSVYSKDYNQYFFDNKILVRDIDKKIFSFLSRTVFFTNENSLMMTGNMYPYMEDNNVTDKCIPIQGSFDIGRWLRPLEFSFILNSKSNSFTIDRGEIYQYIKFNTDENINFIQFSPNKKIYEFIYFCESIKNFKKSFWKMENFYKSFKLKKKILKEIEEQVI